MKKHDKQLRVVDYLEHILEAIRRIDHYTEDMTESVFLEDKKTQDAVVRNLVFTIIGGLMFVGCQAIEWTHLFSEGAGWGHNPFLNANGTLASPNFTNYFFTITGFHGFHVSIGILLNIIVLIMTLCNVFEKRGSYLMIEKIGLYWHFVDLVWVFVFTCFYLI